MADVGDQIIIHSEFRNRTGDLADPTTVTGWIRKPDDSVVALNVTRQSLGIYEAPYLIQAEGEHWIRIESSGTIVSAKEKKLTVPAKRVVHP